MKKIKCNAYCKTAILIAIIAGTLAITGCSGSTHIKTTQTVTTLDSNGTPVTVVTENDIKKPKDIAHEEAAAAKHVACRPVEVDPQKVTLGLMAVNPMELKSGAAQSKYFDSVNLGQMAQTNQILALALKGDPSVACHKAVASESIAYYAMEAKRSSNRWSFGKFLAGAAGAVLITDSITSSLATAGAVGDTNIGEVNVSGSSAGGAGGEAAGGAADINQNVNIGNGTLNTASEGGLNAFGEKPIQGDNNVFEDNDSPNTSIF